MSLDVRVKYFCKEMGITQKGLAEKMGVVKNQLYKHLKNNPTLKTIIRIADALDLQPSDLLGSDDFFGVIHYKNETFKMDTYKTFVEVSKTIENDFNNYSNEFYTFTTSDGKTFTSKDLSGLKKAISDFEDSINKS